MRIARKLTALYTGYRRHQRMRQRRPGRSRQGCRSPFQMLYLFFCDEYILCTSLFFSSSSLCILPPQTVKTCEVFLDNYTQIYFLAIACKTHFKSNSYPWKLSCALLSLMNERAEPVLSEDEDLDDFVESFNEDNASETATEVPTRHPISPTFYTMLLFHRAFCEYTFNDNFDFLKRNDLYFGSGTLGQ